MFYWFSFVWYLSWGFGFPNLKMWPMSSYRFLLMTLDALEAWVQLRLSSRIKSKSPFYMFFLSSYQAKLCLVSLNVSGFGVVVFRQAKTKVVVLMRILIYRRENPWSCLAGRANSGRNSQGRFFFFLHIQAKISCPFSLRLSIEL